MAAANENWNTRKKHLRDYNRLTRLMSKNYISREDNAEINSLKPNFNTWPRNIQDAYISKKLALMGARRAENVDEAEEEAQNASNAAENALRRAKLARDAVDNRGRIKYRISNDRYRNLRQRVHNTRYSFPAKAPSTFPSERRRRATERGEGRVASNLNRMRQENAMRPPNAFTTARNSRSGRNAELNASRAFFAPEPSAPEPSAPLNASATPWEPLLKIENEGPFARFVRERGKKGTPYPNKPKGGTRRKRGSTRRKIE